MEVDVSWLEEEPAAGGAKSKPPIRRETMDVRLEWLEEEPTTPARRKSSRETKAVRDTPASGVAAKRASQPPKAARSPWQPPTLPPPPATATKTKRAMPPPLPREEPEEKHVKRPSKPPR